MWKKCRFLLLLFLKNVFRRQEGWFQMPICFFFLNITVFYFSYLSFVDVDTIENDLNPLHIIADKNQEFIFLLKPFHIHEWKISLKKDSQSVNVKSMNGKILDVGCNNTVTIPLFLGKK